MSVKERLNIILAETQKTFRMKIFAKTSFAQVCHSSLQHPCFGASTFELLLLQLLIPILLLAPDQDGRSQTTCGGCW